jgi:hypothetical protein
VLRTPVSVDTFRADNLRRGDGIALVNPQAAALVEYKADAVRLDGSPRHMKRSGRKLHS